RYDRFMQKQQLISTAKLQRRIGQTMQVLIDEVDEEGAIGRCYADAPEIDGLVYLNGDVTLKSGDLVTVKVEHSDEYDLWASRLSLSDMSA
ncbi:MAG: ribosomal protein S12 methylthiotransferase, partial [Paraglaciecola sp.]